MDGGATAGPIRKSRNAKRNWLPGRRLEPASEGAASGNAVDYAANPPGRQSRILRLPHREPTCQRYTGIKFRVARNWSRGAPPCPRSTDIEMGRVAERRLT